MNNYFPEMIENEHTKYLYKKLISFLKNNDQDMDGWAINMARSFVMVICEIEDINIDTMMWDRLIYDSYNDAIRENWGDEYPVDQYDLDMGAEICP